MKKHLRTLLIFCLWSTGFYFFNQVIFKYLGYGLNSWNDVLDFLEDYQIIIALALASTATFIGAYKKWDHSKQLIIIKLLFSYFLGFSLLCYGLTKLLQTQFVVLPFARWQVPLENLPGTSLAWAFLGYSPWFQVLLGFLEFIPSILLLFRRTAFLGSILLLPVTLNVFLINHALDLWAGTKELALIYLGVNILLLLFDWKKIREITTIIIGKITITKKAGWELLIVFIVTTAYLYPYTLKLLDYKNQQNILMGDWFNKHPAEWSLQSEKLQDSTLSDHRKLKTYYGAYGQYSEINDSGYVKYGNNHYEIDEKKQALNLTDEKGNATHLSYKLLNDSTLETVKIIDSLKSIKLTQVFRKRVINKDRYK